jgi:hypothetical protein
MQHHIFKSDIDRWWEQRCDEFIFQETELRKKNLRVVKDTYIILNQPMIIQNILDLVSRGSISMDRSITRNTQV